MNPHDIIIKPIVTEQSMIDAANKKYTFKVMKNANKYQIKDAVEAIFDVDVKQVNVMNMNGKVKRMGRTQGRRANWKKAIVTLTEASKEIKFFENI
ncbi:MULTISPECIES: 50S ribosomal protein L23 [Anaerofustis]|uniref:50S ribosomal protein L23 n=1 Tax=Anaerofustis TaxID=264995 RepID=UPI001A9BFE35|nr:MULTISPECIES: 50S ribosomal protein L23 [Anaerofustis]